MIEETIRSFLAERLDVPVRLSVSRIGEAPIICARTRPRFIGGERARYQEELK